jgi:phospho-N-acetylmuramoyl-pentapeptide-transferase
MKYDLSIFSITSNADLKENVPIMGGLMIIVTVVLLTFLFNWNIYTQIPIIVFLISAILGGLDDWLNIFGRKRVVRKFHRHLRIARVHKRKLYRLWLVILTPWVLYKNIWLHLGSYPGKGIHAGEKIIVQLIIGSIVAWWTYTILGITEIWLPFLGNVEIGLLIIPFIIFTVVSMTNAVNIADGMDGLSSGLLIISFVAYLLIARTLDLKAVSYLDAVVIGSLLGYLYFNIKPARIQMGDVGSLALGTLLSVVAILTHRVILLPVIGGVFVIEIGSSLLQGIYKGVFCRRLLPMAPLHLAFFTRGWSESKTVERFWVFGAIFAILGLLLSTF